MKEIIKNMCGGEGEVEITHLLNDRQRNGKCGLFALVKIGAGSSLGYHEHHNESETYYILSGRGEYDDNGNKRIVEEGDVTFTPDGCGHALKPIGNEPIVFMALILLD